MAPFSRERAHRRGSRFFQFYITLRSRHEPRSVHAIWHGRTAWETPVTFPSLTTLVVCVVVVVATLLALGAAWLQFRKRNSAPPVPPGPQGSNRHRFSHDFDSHEDEWEAMAPYPEHVMRGLRESRLADAAGLAPVYETRESAPPDGHPAHDLREAWESFQDALEQETAPTSSAPASSAPAVPQVRCPRCLSSRVDTRNLARKAGSTIGSVAGATGGMAAALAGAETGAVVGSIAGPLGTVFGGLAGAVIAGLVGSAAGCAAGSAVGGAIDDNVLDNHICLACGHAFSVQQD